MRHGIAAAIFWLLPLFAFAGVIAPDLVTVVYEEDQQAQFEPREGSLVFRPARLGRSPLVVPPGYDSGAAPLFLDLERLFASSQFRGEWGRRLSNLPSFPSARGDALVIDDLDAFVAAHVFDDLLEPVVVADNRELWDPAIFDVIPPLWPVGNGYRFDDFPDPGVDLSKSVPIVPEPTSGLLLSLGLGLLGWSGRQRRALRTGPPAHSSSRTAGSPPRNP
jgi:hypothetical protein